MGKHSAPVTPVEGYDPSDPADALTVLDLADTLEALVNADELGDSSSADWVLSMLYAVAGWPGHCPEAIDYLAPRLEVAARVALERMGFGPQGMETG